MNDHSDPWPYRIKAAGMGPFAGASPLIGKVLQHLKNRKAGVSRVSPSAGVHQAAKVTGALGPALPSEHTDFKRLPAKQKAAEAQRRR